MKNKHYHFLSKVIMLLIVLLPVFAIAQVKFNKAGNSPSSIRFEEGSQPTVSSFFQEYQKNYPLSSDVKMEPLRTATDKAGTHHRFDQYYKDIQIIGAQYVLHEKNGSIWFANGQLVHGIDLDVIPAINEQTALSYALNEINAEAYKWDIPENEAFIKKEQNNPDATYFPQGELKLTSGRKDLVSENISLVYRFDIFAQEPFSRYWVDVDAKTGKIVNKTSRIHEGDVPGSGVSSYNGIVNMAVDQITSSNYILHESTTRGAEIHTYNLQNGGDYPASAVEIGSTTANGPWDAVGVSAHWGAEVTYDYYFIEHGRNSLDNAGFPLNSYVHYQSGLNNAYWTGSYMLYGDGDGVNFNPLVSLDVVGHELTHGVTEFSSNLIYSNESGGLNESFSDIFGNLVEFYAEGYDSEIWRIGEDFDVDGLGFRNMANPNEFGNPDTYLGDYWFYNEVHNTSGVQNFWFYLLAEGGTGTNDVGFNYNVTGLGLDDAGAIAYHNNTSFLFPSATYNDAREGAIACAESLFGVGSQQAISTADAWDAVGVYAILYAEIDVTPPALTFNVPVDGSSSDIISISNIGEIGVGAPDLMWTIVNTVAPDPGINTISGVLNNESQLLEYQEIIYDKSDVQSALKSESSGDGSPGPQALAGGPDAFGYQFIDSDETGGPVFSWTDITATGTAITLSDDAFQEVTLPFTFPFYGVGKSSVKISSNGYLTFGIDGTDYTNDPIPNVTDPNDIICPFWTDLAPNLGGTVHYLSTSTAFIVQYTNIQHYGGGLPYTFQAILNDDGSIFFQYLDMQGTLSSSTVGIEDATASTGLQIAYNNTYVHNNLAVKISLPEACSWITSVSQTSGSTSAGNSNDVTVSVDATGLIPGFYECELRIFSNASNSSLVTVPVTMNVGAAGASISGNVTYNNAASTVLDGCTVELRDIADALLFSTTTDAAGYYEFTGLIDGDYTIHTSTTKAWGGSNTFDATLVLRYSAGVPGYDVFTNLQKRATDVNKTNTVNTFDATLISRRAASIATPTWSAPDYVFDGPYPGTPALSGYPVTISGSNAIVNYQGLCSGDVNGSYPSPAQ